jgi:hypothetical protein
VNQFALPKRFARHTPDSVNNFLDTSAMFFPSWFQTGMDEHNSHTLGQSVETAEDYSGADFNSDMSLSTMILYKLWPADVVQCCAVITEVHEDNDEQSKPS